MTKHGIRATIKEAITKNFFPVAITTIIGALVSGSIGGAWTVLTIATNIPPRISAVENRIGELKTSTESIGNTLAALPNTYITSERYREDLKEIKDDIKSLVKLHTR